MDWNVTVSSFAIFLIVRLPVNLFSLSRYIRYLLYLRSRILLNMYQTMSVNCIQILRTIAIFTVHNM